MINVFSIDFDFWVPEDPRWDFGHCEAPFFMEELWAIRLSQCLAKGEDLRKLMRIADEHSSPRDFHKFIKERCKIPKSCKVAIAESHSSAFYFLERQKDLHIINIDAHHDLGYNGSEEGDVDCGNWIAKLAQKGKVARVTQVYPKWKKGKNMEADPSYVDIDLIIEYGLDKVPAVALSRIFLCRSGAWVPPWLDNDFYGLAISLACLGNATLYGFDGLNQLRRPTLDMAQIEREAAQFREMMLKMNMKPDIGVIET